VIGLDGAAPELLFGEDRLGNLQRLTQEGCYGTLESIIPPITVPAWMCMSTGQDPGTLGVYGFRNRADYSYDGLRIVDSTQLQQLAIWDQVAQEGKRASILGVPPNYPPRKVSGVSVGCFLTPDSSRNIYTCPAPFAREINDLVGDYPVDVRGFRTEKKDWLKDQIYAMSRKHFQLLRHVVQNTEWDYLQFVEIGLDRIQHGFWRHHDPQHRRHEPGNRYEGVIRDYYCYLDEEIGRILELLDEETAVLVVSDHGAQRLDGGFCINQWLVDEGYLVLNTYPEKVTPLAQLDVDWEETTAWSEGGYYARIFLNVRGYEPQGRLDIDDCEEIRDELTAKLEATVDDAGDPLGTVVYKPEEIYRDVRNIAPDLIVHFGGLSWRSIGGVGYPTIHIQENDTGPDDCNHAQLGAFILVAPGNPSRGEVAGAHLQHMAPTLLELGGYDVPDSMSQSPPVANLRPVEPAGSGMSAADEEIVRQRLRGLGYI
jgi:predicted AlkP superfamily phosphohydrolase/phosphomutase